ncbi:hypothetical protein ABBQ32_007524 [Trebouxia sp. C0010 RCD-2024]
MAPKNLIIDTDPGIDDSIAILAAFNCPDKVHIVGMTTIFGNVPTSKATQNAVRLRELAGKEQVPIAEGAFQTLKGSAKSLYADFVHGQDGFGNTNQPSVKGVAIATPAARFIAEMVLAHPGEISILALGPLTNIALAMQYEPRVASHMQELVILGGAFFCNGNVNPCAEANIIGDTEAADFVLGQSPNIRMVGLDVTHTCVMYREQMDALKGQGKYGTFLHQICQFYLQYHREAYQIEAMYLHDPTAFAAVIAPELFTWKSGAVRVVTEGLACGATIMDLGVKAWNRPNGWMGRPTVKVATGVHDEAVVDLIHALLKQ